MKNISSYAIPLALHLLLIGIVVAGLIKWWLAIVILFVASFFIRIKKRSNQWINNFHVSMAICGVITLFLITYIEFFN